MQMMKFVPEPSDPNVSDDERTVTMEDLEDDSIFNDPYEAHGLYDA
jgi:hypothetical protein